MIDRLYKWVPYNAVAGHMAQGWQMGNSYLTETLHARFAVMMWRDETAASADRIAQIRAGEIEPDMDNPEERKAYNLRQQSEGLKMWWARRKANA